MTVPTHRAEARALVAALVEKCNEDEKTATNSPPSPAIDASAGFKLVPSLTDRSSEAEWQAVNRQAISEFVSLVRDSSWRFQGVESNIRIYKNKTPANAPFPSFLGIGDLAVPPMSVLELVSQSEHKAEYDEIFDSARVLHQFSDTTQIEGWTFWTPSRMIVAARDFVLLAHGAKLGDGSLCIIAKSIHFSHTSDKSKDGGERKGFLRATVITGGFLVQPLLEQPYALTDTATPVQHFSETGLSEDAVLGARRCRVLYLAQVDLKGSLPRQLQTQLFQRQPQQIHHMRRMLEKEIYDHKHALYQEKLNAMPLYADLRVVD